MISNTKIFSLADSEAFANKIAQQLDLEISPVKERDFEDGEHKTRPLNNVRGNDVYVIQQLFKDEKLSVNDRLLKMLFLIGAIKDAGANSVTAVVPYISYSRKDRKTKSRDPVTTRYVARMFEAVDTDRVVTMDVHNLQAFQNAFRISTEHMEARIPIITKILNEVANKKLLIMSPDIGGTKRANHFKKYMESVINEPVSLGVMEKERSMGEVTGEMVMGDYEDRTVVIVDDLVSSGSTLSRAAAVAKKRGAQKVYAAVTHGIFVGNANETLNDRNLDKIFVANTLPIFRLSEQLINDKVEIVDVTGFIAEAIIRIQKNGSMADLNQWE